VRSDAGQKRRLTKSTRSGGFVTPHCDPFSTPFNTLFGTVVIKRIIR
jgi:hypothetical protein